jgi:hypothetical protein
MPHFGMGDEEHSGSAVIGLISHSEIQYGDNLYIYLQILYEGLFDMLKITKMATMRKFPSHVRKRSGRTNLEGIVYFS